MLTSKKSTLVPSFDEIVFEHRNRDYGAFQIRQLYETHILKGFLFTVFAILLITGQSVIRELLGLTETVIKERQRVVDIDLKTPPEVYDATQPEKPKASPKNALPPAGNGRRDTETIPLVVDSTTIDPEVGKKPDPEAGTGEGKVPVEGPVLPEGGSGGTGSDLTVKKPAFVDVPDIMPEFPGGEKELFKFLKRALRYPRMPLSEGIEATVYVAFVVKADGSIDDISILKPAGFGFDEEVTRVVSKMPSWKPGKMSGKDVAVRFKMPVKFRLQRQ